MIFNQCALGLHHWVWYLNGQTCTSCGVTR